MLLIWRTHNGCLKYLFLLAFVTLAATIGTLAGRATREAFDLDHIAAAKTHQNEFTQALPLAR